MEYNVWMCKIVVDGDAPLPNGFDSPPKFAAIKAILERGINVITCFSGWGAQKQLTPMQMLILEERAEWDDYDYRAKRLPRFDAEWETADEVVAADDWRMKHCVEEGNAEQPKFTPLSLGHSFLAGVQWQKRREYNKKDRVFCDLPDVNKGDLP